MKVLVVSAHPDDETLGCGGALLRLKKEKHNLFWLIVTNVFQNEGFRASYVKKRQKEIETVSNLFGFKKTYNLNFPTAKLDTYSLKDIIDKVAKVMEGIKPEILFVPYKNDIHSDHRITFNSVMACSKSFNSPWLKKIYMYETISETEFSPPLLENAFIPNCFYNISKYIDKKIEIMKVYASELKQHPFPRSVKNIRALAEYRGAMTGVEYAEAFMVLKEVV